MAKKAYYGKNIVDEFVSAIVLLLEAYGSCTPTDVLRLVGVEENTITRQIVIDVAEMMAWSKVESSGRGYRIVTDGITF